MLQIKTYLFARREADKLWKYDTETQKWTQDTHYENSRTGCRIISLPWNHQRMCLFQIRKRLPIKNNFSP